MSKSDIKSKPIKRKAVPDVDASTIMDIDAQIKTLSVVEGKQTKGDNRYMRLSVSRSNPLGPIPIVVVRNAPLGATGKRSERGRGLRVIDSANGSFMTLALGLNRDTQKDLRTMLLAALRKHNEKFDPVQKSLIYQKAFPDLDDGTKVFKASYGLQSEEALMSMELSSPEWDSPSRTFGPFLFSEEEDVPAWYTDVSVGTGFEARDTAPATDYRVLFYDDKGKQIPSKSEDGLNIYSKGGIPLSSSKMVNAMTTSEFYLSNRWLCTAALHVTSIVIKIGMNAQEERVLYPVFKMRTSGSIRMQMAPPQDMTGVITFEQRGSLLDAIIFEGVSGPSKKRRRPAASVKTFKKPAPSSPSADTEELSEEELDGEE